jgi:hypothetical protein
MNYNLRYKEYIDTESRIAKTQIEPMNIYRISSYKTIEGDIQSKGGNQSDLVFVIGTFPTPQKDRKINCLKISEIRPDKFMMWLKKLVDKRKVDETDTIIHLNELLIKSDNTGKLIFERFIKPSSIVYNLKDSIYRTYNTNGIRYIQEVFLKKEKLKELG